LIYYKIYLFHTYVNREIPDRIGIVSKKIKIPCLSGNKVRIIGKYLEILIFSRWGEEKVKRMLIEKNSLK